MIGLQRMKNDRNEHRLVAFTGGGTGGHLFPGIAVAEALKKCDRGGPVSVVWIGGGKRMEREIVQRFSIPFRSIPAGKLRRYLSLENFLDVFRVGAGIVSSIFLLTRLRPALLFSKGGYVSVPPVIAAAFLKIPVWIHESDSDPGLATRIGCRYAKRIFISYEETMKYFPEAMRGRITVTGNPVRAEIAAGNAAEGRRIAGCAGDEPLLLALGGSQGALQVNDLMAGAADSLLTRCTIIHQTGEAPFAPPARKPGQYGYTAARFFTRELPHLLAAADLVVSRAGAGTVWENAVCGKPAVLIPLGTGSSRGDQIRNARIFADRGAAVVLAGDDAAAEKLAETVIALLEDPARRSEMGAAARGIAGTPAADAIAAEIVRELGQRE